VNYVNVIFWVLGGIRLQSLFQRILSKVQ